MGIDIEALKNKISQAGMNVETFAKNIEMDRTTFYRKLNAGGVKFTVSEIQRIISALKLTKEEATSIFFIDKVAEMRL